METLTKEQVAKLQKWAQNHPEKTSFFVSYSGLNCFRGRLVNEFTDDTSYKDETIADAIQSFEDEVVLIRSQQGPEFENRSRHNGCGLMAVDGQQQSICLCCYVPEQFGDEIKFNI